MIHALSAALNARNWGGSGLEVTVRPGRGRTKNANL